MDVPAALQRAWIRELRFFFDLYNQQYLAEELRPPIFRLGDSEQRLGEWNPQHRTITVSLRHIFDQPWSSVLETLRHEMAHQYVHEVLGWTQARPHGDAFVRACRLLRVDASPRASTESLGTIDGSEQQRDQMICRVKELLALAKSPNEHEAANAMRMANKYLLKYNLQLAELDGPREYVTKQLGRCSGRIQEWEYTLSHILQEHFFVVVIWTFSYDAGRGQRGRVLEVSGTAENVEIAEYVHDYVKRTAVALWETHRRQHPGAGGTRHQYLAGLLQGLCDKLDRQRHTLKKEHGLVWLGDSQLKDFFRHQHPRTRTTGGGGVSRGERYAAGREDGKKLTIHRGVKSGATQRGRRIE